VTDLTPLRRRLCRPHLCLIAIVGVIVPKRLRADWREEWEAELRIREQRLADWDRLDWWERWDLLRRSSSAFWDALSLQRQRREEDVIQDLQFGLRMLVKSPTFTCVSVLTLAIGIGANTAVFTVVNALLLRPLDGVAQPDRLVQIGRQFPDKAYLSDSSYPDYLDYRTQNTVLSGLSAVAPRAFHITARRITERVEGELVSSDYFDVLGVTAARGRLMAPDDDRDVNGGHDVVLSHRFWQRSLGGDPSVVGETIDIDGYPFTVIGIASESFAGIKIGTPRDVWVPLLSVRRTDPAIAGRLGQRMPSWLEMVGRLKPDVTVEQVRAELTVVARRLVDTYPDTTVRAAVGVEPGLGRDADVQRAMRRFVNVPFVAVGVVLLIACANVAGLLLARAATRRREIATRLALGAGRIRVVRQLLTESLVLTFIGGAGGLVVGSWLTTGLRALLPERYLFLSFNLDFSPDWRVFGYTLGVTTATGVLFGLVPALQASRPNLVCGLKGVSAPDDGRTVAVRSMLVIVQVALSMILLVTGALCVRTLLNVTAIDLGYRAETVLTARLDLAKQRYNDVRGRLLHQQLLTRLQGLPGVDAAGLAVTLPLNDGRWEDRIRRQGETTRVQTFLNVISPGYFDALSIPRIAGRVFSDGDDQNAPKVAILNQTLARTLWPDESPIGRRVSMKGQLLEIVGVVRDIKGRNLLDPAAPMLYVPLSQSYQPNVILHVRTSGAPTSLVADVRRQLHELDKDLAIYAVAALSDHVSATVTPQRVLAYLVGGFGVLALLLAAVGLYGLVAYTVTARTSEIGIRMALGARRTDVVGLFVGGGMKLAIAGVILGAIAASGATPLMKSLLFGVSPLDAPTLIVVSVLLVAVTLAASSLPAHRAARSDPKLALRCE
jgi:predicted permease